MPSRSHRKGDNGERELCKILGNIFGHTFTRVPTSGAMVGGINVARRANLSETQLMIYRGDIIPPDILPQMVIEVKFYADFPFHQIIQNGDVRLLDTWIDQVRNDVHNEKWFVAFKINRRGWYVVFDQKLIDQFELNNYAAYKDTIICELTPFFESNRKAIMRLCGRKKKQQQEMLGDHLGEQAITL